MKIRIATFDEVEAAGIADVLHNEPGVTAYTIEHGGVRIVGTGDFALLGPEHLVGDIEVEDAVAERRANWCDVPVDVRQELENYEKEASPMRTLRIIRTSHRGPVEWTLVSFEVGREPFDFNWGGEPCTDLDQFRNWIAADWKFHLGLTDEEHAYVVDQYYDLFDVEEQRPPVYRCCGESCPGLPYRASDHKHPASCVEPPIPAGAVPFGFITCYETWTGGRYVERTAVLDLASHAGRACWFEHALITEKVSH